MAARTTASVRFRRMNQLLLSERGESGRHGEVGDRDDCCNAPGRVL
jgi:hypothetical protein